MEPIETQIDNVIEAPPEKRLVTGSLVETDATVSIRLKSPRLQVFSADKVALNGEKQTRKPLIQFRARKGKWLLSASTNDSSHCDLLIVNESFKQRDKSTELTTTEVRSIPFMSNLIGVFDAFVTRAGDESVTEIAQLEEAGQNVNNKELLRGLFLYVGKNIENPQVEIVKDQKGLVVSIAVSMTGVLSN